MIPRAQKLFCSFSVSFPVAIVVQIFSNKIGKKKKTNKKMSVGRKSDLVFSISQRTWKSDCGDKLSATPKLGNCTVWI